VNSTLVFLFLSFTVPLVAAFFAYGTAKWPNPGPWALSAGLYKLVTVLAIVGMGVILFIAVAPPNDRVLWVVLGFLALALVLWFTVEKNRFEGPPVGDRIAQRKAAIAAAERAVGESA
jgi:amino acid transporter